MARRRVKCEFSKCKNVFWSKVKGGVVLDNFCRGCRDSIRQQEMRGKATDYRKRREERIKKKMEEKKRLPDKRGAQAPTSHHHKRELPKIKGRTPDQIRAEIRFLEYRRAVELPRKVKGQDALNSRIMQAEDILVKAIKNLREELEVAERLGIKGHGKKKRKN